MQDVEIRRLDQSLRERCLALRLRPEQVPFVPSVSASLELAAGYPDAVPLAILVGSDVVGFAMYGIDSGSGLWKIFRLMIDVDWQGKGVGRAAVKEVVRVLAQEMGAKSILVSYQKENELARRLYVTQGFQEQSVERGKVTARWDAPPHSALARDVDPCRS